MKVPFSPPDITKGEIEKVTEVLRSGWITTGSVTKRLETDISRYCGVKKTACLNSATAAMELSLRLLGIGPGDEVITPAYTYSSSASVIDHVGATIVFADSVEGDAAIDWRSVTEKITERTKAVIPVDIGGIPADYRSLYRVLEEKKDLFSPKGRLQQAIGRIAVVGDAAHAFGALYRGKDIAGWTDFCCFSFHAVKNLTTAEGGAVCFGDFGDIPAEEVYKEFMLLSLHGQSKDAFQKTQPGQWEYDILYPAYKYNMPDILAALGSAQLERYAEMLLRRKQLVRCYDDAFSGTRVLPRRQETSDYSGSYHLYMVKIDGINEERRNRLMEDMGERGVALNVHFKPLPLMTAYRNLGFSIENYPNAYDYFKGTVTLPLFSVMTDAEQDYVIEQLLDVLRQPEYANADR